VASLLLAGCGAAPVGVGTATSPTPSAPRSTSLPSPSIPAGWHTYADPQSGFTIAYPAGFTVQNEGGDTTPGGAVKSYRAYDPQYVNGGYPRGQVESAIHAKDAATLNDWVARHTGPPSGPTASPQPYWEATSNLQSTTAAGRGAIYFEWTALPGPFTVHVLAFFWKSNSVFRLEWWADDSAYLTTMDATGRQMLNSFQG
jgi:hypothetical protein